VRRHGILCEVGFFEAIQTCCPVTHEMERVELASCVVKGSLVEGHPVGCGKSKAACAASAGCLLNAELISTGRRNLRGGK
jgi:hypothetical protein